jgi:mannose-1-phosphate guanylyltransferase
LSLFGEQSLFQDTLSRLSGLEKLEAPIIVCNDEHRFLVAEQLHEINSQTAKIMLEPCARNTAPAIAIAALQAKSQGDDPVMLVLAADHIIHNHEAFHNAINQANLAAQQGKVVTFGIIPDSAHTGYGYIEAQSKTSLSKVTAFVEKPNKQTAERYIESGNYYWNSGMFVFKASTILNEFELFAPEMLLSCQQALARAKTDLDFIRLDHDAFSACPSDSLDYTVMEKTDKAVVIALDAGWSDVGSWSSLWDNHDKDVHNNVLVGDVILEDVSNSYIHSEQRLVSVLGVDNLIVVETPDAVMIADKGKAENIKTIVTKLQSASRDEATVHRKCYRPWGYYDSIDRGERFQVKRISVNPGASLSLQLHHHRAEHWVVVKGTAEVTCGEEVSLLAENESTFIPLGTQHRLRNPGQVPLEIIEVQSGGYLGEDDIVRFDDHYNRN